MGATYRPLAEVRKDLRVRWYRCPLDREFVQQSRF